MASKYEDVLNRAASIVRGVMGAVPVKVRKLPVDQEVLDMTPIVCVSPDVTAEEVGRLGFEKQRDVVYTVEIVGATVNAANYDPTNCLPLLWRERIRKKFWGESQNAVSGWWMTDVEMDTPLDRQDLSANYDYTSMRVKCHVTETAN
jgi:hypothetical protein